MYEAAHPCREAWVDLHVQFARGLVCKLQLLVADLQSQLAAHRWYGWHSYAAIRRINQNSQWSESNFSLNSGNPGLTNMQKQNGLFLLEAPPSVSDRLGGTHANRIPTTWGPKKRAVNSRGFPSRKRPPHRGRPPKLRVGAPPPFQRPKPRPSAGAPVAAGVEPLGQGVQGFHLVLEVDDLQGGNVQVGCFEVRACVVYIDVYTDVGR